MIIKIKEKTCSEELFDTFEALMQIFQYVPITRV